MTTKKPLAMGRSYIPRLSTWEFVPDVPILVPELVPCGEGGTAFAREVHQELRDQYRHEFYQFVTTDLGLTDLSDSWAIVKAMDRFWGQLESYLQSQGGPADLWNLVGVQEWAERVCHGPGHQQTWRLTDEAARELVLQVPPRELAVSLDRATVGELLHRISAQDVLALAAWVEPPPYTELVLDVVGRYGQPSWFERAPVQPLAYDLSEWAAAHQDRGSTGLVRLAGRVVVSPYGAGHGGAWPTLWFILRLLHHMANLELWDEVWTRLEERPEHFGKRLASALSAPWGRHATSASHLSRNRLQRRVARALASFNECLTERPTAEGAELLTRAAAVYHLSLTLADSTFLPLSAWTWASHSFDGGTGAPSALSSRVERDWATRDFLVGYAQRAGWGDSEDLDQLVVDLLLEGKQSDDVVQHLFDLSVDAYQVVVPQAPREPHEPAGQLRRPVEGPILSPRPDHSWESRYVLNAAAMRLDGKIFIVYRAFGDDKVSRLGLAWTSDGLHIEGRLDQPIFAPSGESERAGVEDPRIVVIGDDLWMLYTAYDGDVAQIALASIPVTAFLEKRFDQWVRHGLALPGVWNKDAVVYPETFGGRYAVYHRVEPSMWIAYLDRLECPWPRQGHRIVASPRPGLMWDGVKIGAGAQPLKTTLGWLSIYHGVDHQRAYRLGAMLMASDDPAQLLYRSPNPILQPEIDFEIGQGEGGDFWVPQVVFTCGAVPAKDVEVLGPNDQFLVYYGAADTAIGVAQGTVRDIIPDLTPRKTTGY
jgi:predicted GH43/DUF377 family glycosyl hydrolase